MVILLQLGLLIAGAASGAGISEKVMAEEILKKIERSEAVDYDRVIVVGDLDLSRLDLPKDQNGIFHIEVPLKIEHSTIEGYANFAGAIFSKTADFAGTTFVRDAVFSGAQFSEQLNLEGANFNEDASFDESKFERDAKFNKVKFSGASSFYEAKFDGDASFYATQLSGDCNFNKAKFNAGAYFDGAAFNSYANFVGAEFYGDASFYQTMFHWNANFADAKSAGTSYLKGAQFDKLASFTGAEFGRYASFEDAEFKGDADFNSVQFRDSYFWGTKYGGKLTLNNTQFSVMQVEWNSIKGNLVYNEATYLSLIKNFEILGYYGDSDNCYYQYRREKQAREPAFGSKSLDVIALISCGYGVRPHYTFILSLLVTFLFGIIFWLANACPEHKGPNTNAHFPKKRDRISFIDAVYFSALAFVTPHESVHWRSAGFWRYIVLFEHIIGWLLMALFLVTLGKVMIR